LTSIFTAVQTNAFNRFLFIFLVVFNVYLQGIAQTRPAAHDTLMEQARLRNILNKLLGITITGFMEPEFQVGQAKGENSFSGGNFASNSNNRFLIRRGRIRTSYLSLNRDSLPVAEICFELDGTQRGININEWWGKIYENKWQLFSLSAGMLVRPFGNEITYPTRQFESPERGRMSQTLMRGEVDLGAMISFEPRKKNSPFRQIKASLGIFNGQGLTGPSEVDAYKDLIARVALKPLMLSSKLLLSGGISFFNGGIEQASRYIYRTTEVGGIRMNTVDSSSTNIGRKAPRKYYGADLQLKYLHGKGATEIRAEYWRGTQTSSASSSETPSTLLQEPGFIRTFNGAFIYLIHTMALKHQLCIKYDVYDPNLNTSQYEIGRPGANLTAADIKYSTLGFGYIYYWNTNLKLMLWYDVVRNENTLLTGYTADLKDNVFTCRLQFRF